MWRGEESICSSPIVCADGWPRRERDRLCTGTSIVRDLFHGERQCNEGGRVTQSVGFAETRFNEKKKEEEDCSLCIDYRVDMCVKLQRERERYLSESNENFKRRRGGPRAQKARIRLLPKSTTRTIPSGVTHKPLGLSICNGPEPCEPNLLLNTPCGEKICTR